MNNDLKTASVLAFERKLDPSDALLFAGEWSTRSDSARWSAVKVREKSVRGTISNYLETKDQDPTKLDAMIENPNLQTVDVATLPADADTLKVRFTLRVLGGAGTPSACNSSGYQAKLVATVKSYVEAQGFNELARRYAGNLANGRFLWRNRFGAEQVEVHIAHQADGNAKSTWIFDALSLSLRGFEGHPSATSSLDALSSLIADGLSGNSHVLLEVTAFARIGAGQEVFPSQELILGRERDEKKTNKSTTVDSSTSDRGRGKKGKTLYTVQGVAGIHSQKLGNAIRTIDTWYTGADELGPIAVEPYGSVTSQGKAYRQPREKTDFYSLLDSWITKDKTPAIEQQHFVIATLIRGGVFGKAGKSS